MASLSPSAKQQFFTNAGAPAAGYNLYTYATGTTTPLATYTDKAGSVANTNPIVLDARGEAILYLQNVEYRYVLKDTAGSGSTIWTRDNIQAADTDIRSDITSTAAGKGADLIGYDNNGTATTVGAMLDVRTRISVKDPQFGAVGDGVADDTAAFNAAVTYCASRNGGVIFVPAGTYKIASAITVSSNAIVFQGEGFDTSHDTGSSAHTTHVMYTGGAVDSVFLFTSISGASNKCLTGCGVLDLAIHGGNTAVHAVRLMSHREGRWRFYGASTTGTLLYMGCVDALGEAADTQSNVVELWGRQFSSGGGGVTLAADNANSGSANTSFNQFKIIDVQVSTGTGVVFGNSDTNFFDWVRITGVTTGKAYTFLGSSTGASQVARGNFIRWFSSSGPGYAYGTTTYAYPSYSNYIGLDIGNGTPYPTIETGATCFYSASGVIPFNPSAAQMSLAGSVPNAIADKANVSGETLRLHSTNSKNLYLTDGTNTWGIYLTGGNLRVKLVAGSGTFGFGSWSSSSDAAVNGYVTIQDFNGNTRKLATIA